MGNSRGTGCRQWRSKYRWGRDDCLGILVVFLKSASRSIDLVDDRLREKIGNSGANNSITEVIMQCLHERERCHTGWEEKI
jgi:hypothetical protein